MGETWNRIAIHQLYEKESGNKVRTLAETEHAFKIFQETGLTIDDAVKESLKEIKKEEARREKELLDKQQFIAE